MINVNFLWEMGAAERVIEGILDRIPGLVDGLTCGAGMPYRLADIAMRHNVWFYPIISSHVPSMPYGSALTIKLRSAWRPSFTRIHGVQAAIMACPTVKTPTSRKTPIPASKLCGTRCVNMDWGSSPIIMAGGVWRLDEWQDWIGNRNSAPSCFNLARDLY